MDAIFDRSYLDTVLDAVKSWADVICSVVETAGEGVKLFPGQINPKTLKIPAGTPEDPGFFADNRELQGCHPHCHNLLFDLGSLDVFYTLEGVTGGRRYNKAADEYLKWFFENCLYPGSRYFPWGEHVGYDMVKKEIRRGSYKGGHEVKDHIIPWDCFWRFSPEAVRNEISVAFRSHICDEKTFAFNRHAAMDGTPNTGSWPCSLMDSGGLYLYGWAWLYKKEGKAELLNWVKRMHALPMAGKSKTTGLFCTAEDRPDEMWYHDVLSYAALVLPAAALLGDEGETLRKDALDLIGNYYKYAYNAEKGLFYDTLNISSGKPVTGLSPHCPEKERSNPEYIKAYTRPEFLPVWENLENSNNVTGVLVSSAVSYFYSKDRRALDLFTAALKTVDIPAFVQSGKKTIAGKIAGVILALCHIYRLTGEENYLREAAPLVEYALKNNYRNGIFVTAFDGGDEYYCTRGGTGDLASALLAFWIACCREDLPLPLIRDVIGDCSW
ncbi:MAG: hypothetical protein LBF78_06075 [Treponema sp.]|jgi:hypothetical protein|nr:hypothetical protein [Treponema sp.]